MDSVIHLLNNWGPDLQIRWGGGGHPDPEIRGGGLKKTFFQPFGLQFGLKIRGGAVPPGPYQGFTTESSSKTNQGEKCF